MLGLNLLVTGCATIDPTGKTVMTDELPLDVILPYALDDWSTS
jgi:hypothetical protein